MDFINYLFLMVDSPRKISRTKSRGTLFIHPFPVQYCLLSVFFPVPYFSLSTFHFYAHPFALMPAAAALRCASCLDAPSPSATRWSPRNTPDVKRRS